MRSHVHKYVLLLCCLSVFIIITISFVCLFGGEEAEKKAYTCIICKKVALQLGHMSERAYDSKERERLRE